MRPPQSFGRSRRAWWKRWFPLLACLGLLALAPVLAHSQTATDTLVVTWTAPGDDDRLGTASTYDLRMSLAPIDASNFASATSVPNVPAPAASGTRQRVTVRGLTRGTLYYFAIRAADDAGNWSPISNVAHWDWTLDTAPPASPTGVGARKEGRNVRVSWSANAEADLRGYTVYRAAAADGPYTKVNATLIAASEWLDDTVPNSATTVWYQVTASDVTGNESARSAAASLRLRGPQTSKEAVAMEPGYPNPSGGPSVVHIPVVLQEEATAVTTAVVDVLDSGGRRVRRLEVTGLSAGRQEITWDGRNDAGRLVAPGVYRAWLMAGGARTSIRLVRTP